MASGPGVPPIQAHLCVRGGEAALAFYAKAFGASVAFRQMAEDGQRVMHANLELFGGEVMLHDEFPEFGGDVLAPDTRGGASMTVSINLRSPAEVNAAMDRAASAGAIVVLPAQDVFWGARYGKLRDPFGHVWAFNAPLGGV